MKRRRFREASSRGALALDPKAFDFFFEATETADNAGDNGITVVSITGPLEHHDAWWFDSYESILKRIERAFADEETRAVVLRIDSPGGDASGMVECHEQIRKMRAEYEKPIFAYADECAASAAYGIACACDEVWQPKTGHVGSVGVIATIVDQTARNRKEGYDVRLLTTGKRKGDGHPDKPLDDESLAALQGHVDTLGASFFAIVSAARGLSVDAVQALEAGVFYGKKAIKAGLADGVAGWDEFLAGVREKAGLASMAQIGSAVAQQSKGKRATEMDELLQLTKAVAKAEAAVLYAKSDKEREKALAAFSAAVEAKSKFKKKTTTVEEEEDDGEEESEEAEASEAEDDDSDAGSEATEKSSTAESTSAEEAEEGKKALEAKTGLHTYARLFRLCKQVTGKATVRGVFDALDKMGEKLAKASAVRADVRQLKKESRRAQVDAVIAKALAERRITPGEKQALRAVGMTNLALLKNQIAVRPKSSIRSLEDGEIPPNPNPEAYAGAMGGRSAAAQDIIKRTAARLGKTEEEVAATLDAAERKKSNGASARY